jgi:hypothetical protein
MATFVRTAAVFVGFANTTVFVLIGDKPLEDTFLYFLGDLPQWPVIVLYAISAVGAGFLVSSVVLRFMQPSLRGIFFARYGVMVLAVCLGGVLLSVSLSAVTYAFDDHLTVTKRITWALSTIPLTAVAGGVLGAAEGVILAFPLAAILGRFRTAG